MTRTERLGGPRIPNREPSTPPGGPSEPAPGTGSGTAHRPGRQRVLLVDDDRDTLVSLKHYVEAHIPEAEVVTARSPLDALDVVDQTDVRVVITDLRMPEMDGLEFWRRARDYRSDLVGMLITANIDLDLQQTAEREGLAACLSKPFDMNRLRKQLETMMDQAAPAEEQP